MLLVVIGLLLVDVFPLKVDTVPPLLPVIPVIPVIPECAAGGGRKFPSCALADLYSLFATATEPVRMGRAAPADDGPASNRLVPREGVCWCDSRSRRDWSTLYMPNSSEKSIICNDSNTFIHFTLDAYYFHTLHYVFGV